MKVIITLYLTIKHQIQYNIVSCTIYCRKNHVYTGSVQTLYQPNSEGAELI